MIRTSRQQEWEGVYRNTSVKDMGWYYPDLDPDLENALDRLNIRSGSFLDLGTGPGTQAIELAGRGFSVTGTDISERAIEGARNRNGSKKVRFIQDDILHSNLRGTFDFIFDRGCFHTLEKMERHTYVHVVRKLLNPGGRLFLKCFSDREPEGWGPYRFSMAMIDDAFTSAFEIENMIHTLFPGTRMPLPNALFAVMKGKNRNEKK